MNNLNIENPSIYVADLGAYVAGRLIGEWLDLTKFSDVEALQKEVDRISKLSDYGDEWVHIVVKNDGTLSNESSTLFIN